MTNIALVVLDTMRKDSFDEFFSWLPGVRFENAWATSSWTIPVHASMFAGGYPSELGVHIKNEQLDCEDPVLAERLADAGYTTRAYSCNQCVSPTFDFDRGFEEFTGNWHLLKRDPEIFDWSAFISRTNDRGPSRYLSAVREIVNSECKTLPSLRFGARLKLRDMGFKKMAGMQDDGAESTRNFVSETEFTDEEFLFLNLMEAHAPYDPPDSYKTVELTNSPSMLGTVRGTDVDPATLRQAYDDSVRYLADKYRDIFGLLKKDFDVIITVGDHGEMFGEDGVWGHSHGLHPGLTHVPLSIYHEDSDGTEEAMVSLKDIYNTILDLAGVEDARNILEDPDPQECLTERFGLNERRKEPLREAGIAEDVIDQYDRVFRGLAIPENCYVHQTLSGFTAEGECADSNGRERLQSFVDGLDEREIEEQSGKELPDDVMDRLSDLGYA